MATKSKKKEVVTDQVVIPEVTVQPKMQSIAFDKNSNLYGISTDSKVYQFNFITKEWVQV